MQKAIVFRHPWCGRVPGQIDRELAPNVMDVLVNYRRVAEWHVDPEQQQKPKRRDRHAIHS
jgi:hypothetical protein